MRRVVGMVAVVGASSAGLWFAALSPSRTQARRAGTAASSTARPALGSQLHRLVMGTMRRRKVAPSITVPSIQPSQTCNVATGCSLVPCVIYTAAPAPAPAMAPQVPGVAVRPQAGCAHKPARAVPVATATAVPATATAVPVAATAVPVAAAAVSISASRR